MSSKKAKAFPVIEEVEHDSGWYAEATDQGMDLRDWFAGQVLSKCGDARNISSSTAPHGELEMVAIYCYRVADAMMKARQEC